MDTKELLAHIDRYIEKVAAVQPNGIFPLTKAISEFLRRFAGEKSSFFLGMGEIEKKTYASLDAKRGHMHGILEQYRDFVGDGMHETITPERKAKIDVVSDFLGQADTLLSTKGVHPVCAAVLVGASLEAFLREWVEAEKLKPTKPGLDGYAQALLAEEKINKQDVKDITAWAGRRNYAAHGEFDEVADARNIRQMLDGVNLFMRKYTPNK